MDVQESQSNWPEMRKTLGKPGFCSGEDRNRTFLCFFNVFPFSLETGSKAPFWSFGPVYLLSTRLHHHPKSQVVVSNPRRSAFSCRPESTDPFVPAYATAGSSRARAQSAVADGTRARNRTLRVIGINATSVTVHKPPFPSSRIMLLISISLPITKFPPEQRVDQDGMIRLRAYFASLGGSLC